MRSDAWQGHLTGDVGDRCGVGNGSERQIGGADFGCAVCLKDERAAVRSGSKISARSVRSGSDELIRRTCVPHGDGAPWSRAKRKKNMVARGIALKERSARETGDLRLRSRLKRRGARHQIQLA